MKIWLWLAVLPVFVLFSSFNSAKEEHPVVIVIHGGAGDIVKEGMTADEIKAYQDKLDEALEAGYKLMQGGGSSTDAVEAAINVMENAGIFDAGKGAVFNSEGKIELDASIMQGKDLKAGAVAGVTVIKNPITAAKAVMQHTRHVLLVAHGAEEFARSQGLAIVDPSYFYTEKSHQDWLKVKAKDDSLRKSGHGSIGDKNKFGTVGVVALDKQGNLAAGTSTGGTTNKLAGRVGDSPLIGAGTYADNASCGVSCTGTGEYFIRLGVARDIADMVAYKGYTVQKALETALEKVKNLGGTGGIIALDTKGNIAIDFITKGMNRGYIDKNGKKEIKMFREN